jgi:DNA-binding SARP family transcriptional activator/predicted ATPase
MRHLGLRLLGGFQATLDQRPVSGFDSDKSRALLAFLLVEADRAHRRESLAALLWPDVAESSARRSLSQAIFNLRQILGENESQETPPFLLIGRESVQFNRAAPHSLDVAAFADQIFQGTVAGLTAAMALYGGDFLQGFTVADGAGFEEWALLQRERLHGAALAALEKLAQLHEQAGRVEEAILAQQRLLELEPWREESHQQLMRLLAASGQRSRALAQFEKCKQLLASELGVDPAAETRRLYEEIRASATVTKPQPRLTHARKGTAPRPLLPAYLTPFLGRADEVAEVQRLLTGREARLVTLTGYGGMGKTRLAVQAAENVTGIVPESVAGTVTEARGVFRDGAIFVPLAAATSPAALYAALGEASGFRFAGDAEPKRQLLEYLSDKQMLVVLDNFESLLPANDETEDGDEGAIAFVLELLAAAPRVKVLITSRERLGAAGEWVVTVQGLGNTAATLFVQSAQRSQRSFDAGANRACVEEICRLVEEMPLAIELAATWVQSLSCAEIANEIRRDLGFLATSSKAIPARHRSIQTVFEQSWSLLPSDAQRVMSQLSLFQGDFQREAAVAISGVTLPQLALLVSKSLLRLSNEGRYQTHELMRQFAAARLATNPTLAAESRLRFAHYYADLLAGSLALLRGPQQSQTFAALKRDWENLRAAWTILQAERQIEAHSRCFAAICTLFELRGLYDEGAAFCAQAATLYSQAAAADEGRAPALQEANLSSEKAAHQAGPGLVAVWLVSYPAGQTGRGAGAVGRKLPTGHLA